MKESDQLLCIVKIVPEQIRSATVGIKVKNFNRNRVEYEIECFF